MRAMISAARRRASCRADDAVAAHGDALGPPRAPGLHDIDLGAGGIDADAEAGERAVPDHRVPARREGVHDALCNRASRRLARRIVHDAPSFPAPAAGAMSAPMLAPTLAADTLSVSRARWA